MEILLRGMNSKKKKQHKRPEELDWMDFDEDDYEDAEDDEDYGVDDEDDEDYEDAEDDEDYGVDDEDDEDYEDEEDDEDYDVDDEDDEDYEDEEDDEDYDVDDEDDEDYEDEDDEDDEPRGIGKIADFLMNMSMVDHIVMFTGLVVLILAGVVGSIYVGTKMDEKQIATFAEVGEGVENIPVIGESGLLAISDAQASKVYAAELEEIEKEATVVDEQTGKIEVEMNLTSIQKDLKIKFINKKSGKLIPNIVFEVEVTKPSGNTYTLKDEDKDGIIYEKNIEPGKYQVKIIGPSDLEEYSFSTDATAITVRDTIEYKKVDVVNEIKTEAQVNVAVEDTKVNETVVESTNTDTVEWVESTKTLIEGTEQTTESYEKVDRSNIVDPSAKAAVGFRLLTEAGGEPTEAPAEPTEAPAGPTEAPAEPTEAPAEPTEAPTAEPTEAPTEEPTQAPTEEPTAEPTQAPTEAPTPTVTPTAAATATPTAIPSATPSSTPAVTASPTATASVSPTATASVSPTASTSPTVTPTVTPSVTPTATPSPADSVKNDTQSNLKTTDGEVLYVKGSDGNFREAKYADYFNGDIKEFYRKISKTTGEYRYTGWQTIDGSVYYFDKNGNKVTGEQVIQGAKYNFNSNGVLDNGSGNLGIDVSKWNGTIDWNAVKNSGISYVIIRCGYRGSTTGALIEDPTFHTNIKGAQNAGLKVGVYFFSQATNEVEAVEEASMALSLVKGYNLTYPIFLDVEASGGRADGISPSTRTAVCKAFCQTIQNSGYKTGIYANKTWFNEYMDTPSLTGYKIWLAQYAATPTYDRTRYDMWQYSSKGKVTGIGGNVDMNISYLGY